MCLTGVFNSRAAHVSYGVYGVIRTRKRCAEKVHDYLGRRVFPIFSSAKLALNYAIASSYMVSKHLATAALLFARRSP